MVIWSGYGILGLLIPIALIVTATLVIERLTVEKSVPVSQNKSDDTEGEAGDEEDVKLKAAERKLAAERKSAAEHQKAAKRADGLGYLIGGLASAAVLWPLGRRLNKPAGGWSDQNQAAAEPPGGGHTMFFIPLEYWAFFWVVVGLFRLVGTA